MGQILVAAGVIDDGQLDEALAACSKDGGSRRLGSVLLNLAFVTEAELAGALSGHLGFRYVDVAAGIAISPDVLKLVPLMLADWHQVLPVAMEDGKLVLAMADPTDILARDNWAAAAGRAVIPACARPSALALAIERHYRGVVPHHR